MKEVSKKLLEDIQTAIRNIEAFMEGTSSFLKYQQEL
jgi:hypothetical protein